MYYVLHIHTYYKYHDIHVWFLWLFSSFWGCYVLHVRLIEYGRCCVVIFARMNPKICKNGWNERPMDSFTFTLIFLYKNNRINISYTFLHLLVLHTYMYVCTSSSKTTNFFGTLQELKRFNCKTEFHFDAKYWSCSNSSIKLVQEGVEQGTCTTCSMCATCVTHVHIQVHT